VGVAAARPVRPVPVFVVEGETLRLVWPHAPGVAARVVGRAMVGGVRATGGARIGYAQRMDHHSALRLPVPNTTGPASQPPPGLALVDCHIDPVACAGRLSPT